MRVVGVLLPLALAVLAGQGPALADEPAPAAPAVVASVTPAALDVTTSPGTVTVSVGLPEDGAVPVTSARVLLTDAAEAPVASGDLAPAPADGTWSGTVTLPAGQAHGALRVDVAAADAAGEVTTTTGVARMSVLDAAPAAPRTVDAAPVAGRTDALAVRWQAPPQQGSSPPDRYSVTAWPAAGPAAVVEVAGGVSEVVVPGLAPGSAYTVEVRAANAVGTGPGAVVGATTAFTAPLPPVGVTAVAGDGSARLTWAQPATVGAAAPAAYRVSAVPALPGGPQVVAPGTSPGTTVPDLSNGTGYAFTVTALSTAGDSAPSAGTAVVVPRRPAALREQTVSAPTVTYGTPTTVTARLVDPAGLAVPGEPVSLYARRAGTTTDQRVGTGTTSATGLVAVRAVLPATSALVLHHAAGRVAEVRLPVPGVAVAPKVTVRPGASAVRLGRSWPVTGTVAPAVVAGVPVRLESYVAGRWTLLATGRTTSTTDYRVDWRPTSLATLSLRVVRPADADHVAGATPTWPATVGPESAADIARDVLADSRVTLATVHVGGVRDQATARQNLLDVAGGGTAARSWYGTAPGGRTALDVRTLGAVRKLGTQARVTVSEVAGGSHAGRSQHYYGRAIDVTYVNGVHVRAGTSYRVVVDTCRSLKATHVWYPTYDPYGGHANHVHCDWG